MLILIWAMDRMFNMLGGNVDDFLSLAYFSGYNASLDPYYMYLEDLPKKNHVVYIL